MNIFTKILTITFLTFPMIQSAMQAPINPSPAVTAPENTCFETTPMQILNGCEKFKTALKDIKTNEKYASIEYAIPKIARRNPQSQGWICKLSVNLNHRRKQYGSVLLNFALEKIRSEKIDKAFLVAEPSDLNVGETVEGMLPKLIKFYERHGAYVTECYSAKSAGMTFDFKEKSSGQ